MNDIQSFEDLINKLGGAAEVALHTCLRREHIQVMKARNSIPTSFFPQFIKAAEAKGIKIDFEILVRMKQARRNAHQVHPPDGDSLGR